MSAYTWSVVSEATVTPAAPGTPAADGEKVGRDLAVDFKTRRLVLVGGNLVFCSGAQSILQDVWLALGMWTGEWFLDLDAGFPYRERVLVKAPDLTDIRELVRQKILSRRGVKDLLDLRLNFNRSARTLAVSFKISTDVGALAAAGTLTVGA